MQRYIGMDVHANSCSFGIIDHKGKTVGQAVVGTNGAGLIEYIKTIPGQRNGEGTEAKKVEIRSFFASVPIVPIPKKEVFFAVIRFYTKSEHRTETGKRSI